MSRSVSVRRMPGRGRRTSVAIILFAASVVGIPIARSAPSAWSALSDGKDSSAAADGVLPAAVTAFADEYPGVAKLDEDLLGALRRATLDAAARGVDLRITSGWRSPAYQRELFKEAVAEHGSAEEAARWVATEKDSAHVTGDAVDVGPRQATEWLSAHGHHYGLCPIYGNEPWHFELRADAVRDGCPPPYADPTHDPRLQRP